MVLDIVLLDMKVGYSLTLLSAWCPYSCCRQGMLFDQYMDCSIHLGKADKRYSPHSQRTFPLHIDTCCCPLNNSILQCIGCRLRIDSTLGHTLR